MSNSWNFSDPPHAACITEQTIVDGAQPVLFVVRDFEDGGYQFLSGNKPGTSAAMVVSLQSMLGLDSTLAALFDLQPGWTAARRTVDAPWNRVPRPRA